MNIITSNHIPTCVTYSRLLYLCICFLPVIDMANGYLMRESGSSVGMLIKGIIMLCIMTILFLFDKQSIKWLAISCSIAIIYTLIHVNYFTDITVLPYEISWTFKFLYFYLCYRFFLYYLRNNYGNIDLLFYIAFLALILNSISSFLGFGYSQYEFQGERVGSRGFFYAGNELGAFLIIVGLYILYFAYKRNIVLYFIVSIALLFAATQLASKVAIIGVILSIPLVPLVFLYANSISIVEYNLTDIYRSFLLIISTMLSGAYSIYYVLYDLNLYSRLYYFSKKFDIITLLFSYRNVWAKEMLSIFYTKANLLNYFFGYSYSIYSYNNNKTVEIDCIDIFLVYGFFGILLTYGFLIQAFIRIFMHSNVTIINKPQYLMAMNITIIILCVSVTAGHVINSGLIASYLAAIISLPLSNWRGILDS